MKNEQQQQAHNLYFNSDLSKTQIAEILKISRTTLYSWAKQGSWDNLKKTSKYMPSLIAEKCYHIMSDLTDHILSVKRMSEPITSKEVETLHKLTLTIGKLKGRSTVNENMDAFTSFMENLKDKEPAIAEIVFPHIEEYLASRATLGANNYPLPSFNEIGRLDNFKSEHQQEIDRQEYLLDLETERILSGANLSFKEEQEAIIKEIHEGAARYEKQQAEQDAHDAIHNPELLATRNAERARQKAIEDERTAAYNQASKELGLEYFDRETGRTINGSNPLSSHEAAA